MQAFGQEILVDQLDASLVLPSENQIIFIPEALAIRFCSRRSGFRVPLLVSQTKEASAIHDSAFLLYPCSTVKASRAQLLLYSIADGRCLPALDRHHELESMPDPDELRAIYVFVLVPVLVVASY